MGRPPSEVENLTSKKFPKKSFSWEKEGMGEFNPNNPLNCRGINSPKGGNNLLKNQRNAPGFFPRENLETNCVGDPNGALFPGTPADSPGIIGNPNGFLKKFCGSPQAFQNK